MLGWLKQKKGPSRERVLAGVIVRNKAVRTAPHGEGVRLIGEVERRGLARLVGGMGSRAANSTRATKTFELDALGAFVWEGIDDKRTVESHIRRFAQEQRVNLREAEVAVLAFLKMLVQRGLAAMVAPAPASASK